MKKNKKLLLLLPIIIFLVFFYTSTKENAIEHSCNVVFRDSTQAEWSEQAKNNVLTACDEILMKTKLNSLFDNNKVELIQYNGNGGASAIKDEKIKFFTSNIQDTKTMSSTFLHEIAHIIDFKRGRYEIGSMSKAWFLVSGWDCENKEPNNCLHPCKQTRENSFHCSYEYYEVLPSRYGNPEYDPREADVSINPIEDFAESSRYFFEANNELARTSISRCRFLQDYYNVNKDDRCLDCSLSTICQ